ncbi:MAG TPA: saccharopine dehydrogenase C-terminal domain-containing protein [Gemmatimonadales bacterium]
MKVLVLGSGAVGTVSALKFAQEAMCEQLVIADAVPGRARQLADRIGRANVRALTLNAGDRNAVARAIRDTDTTILLNAALPATNLTVMRACLDAGANYIDLASGGAENDGTPKLPDQFALDAEFRAAGRLALLGMGADPGTSNVYAAYAAKHLLDQVEGLHVRDGDNSVCEGHSGFLATFSPWVFIDECTCGAVSWRDGQYRLEEPLSGFEPFNFPELGILNTYYVDHEESRTLPMFIPEVRVADFKLCLDDTTWRSLKVLRDLGLHGKQKVRVGDIEISPRDLVVAMLPEPKNLAGRLSGKTCVGTLARGIRDGVERSFYIYNVTSQDDSNRDLGVQATAYQTGVPPVIAARLMATGEWSGTGVMSPEQFDPDPFMALLDVSGMPWHIRDEATGVIDPEYIWIEEPMAA